MIKSAATTQMPLPRKVTQPISFSWGQLFLTLVFRLLLLGIGGSLAAVVGVAIAQLYPAQTQEPPSIEKMMQKVQVLLKVGQPDWNSQTQTSPVSVPSVSASDPVSAAGSLANSERQQLQVELTQLQAELQTLTSQSAEPLANRVQEIQKRIQTIQERLSSFTTQAVTSAPLVSTAASDKNYLMMTLPSDVLFATEQTTLRSDEAILDSILTDLKRYPGATIHVSAHIDQQGADTTDQHRSLEQARAVQQYLSTQLNEDVRWVTIGYGHSRPIVANDSPETRQRNRRIEILIKP